MVYIVPGLLSMSLLFFFLSAITKFSLRVSDEILALFALQPLSLDDLIKKKNEQETLAKVCVSILKGPALEMPTYVSPNIYL